MNADPAEDDRLQILRFWWTLELFSPQQVPKLTRRATGRTDRQVIEWTPGEPLPWQPGALPQPSPSHRTRRVWRHTVYLGVYKLEATYGSLHRVFGEDREAYDEGPGGESACAGVLIDHRGRMIAGTAVLSSALWGVARSHDPGPRDPHWMDGFDAATAAFAEALDRYEGRRREASDGERPPGHDAESLGELLRIAHAAAGVDGHKGLATEHVLIESVAVPARHTTEPIEIDFLNSFFLDDLANLRGEVARGNAGPALNAYLTGDDAVPTRARTDVLRDPRVIDTRTAIEWLPKGRWPANPNHPLALSQQFAVNEALNRLGPGAGLMGVNGPPGTGKTTMLRDILAGNVVDRARRLAALERADDAFTDVTHRWTGTQGHPRIVRQLRPELTGFEMVVASSNNAAVENVTTEIPVARAIDERWRDEADYFGQIATRVLLEAEKDSGPVPSERPPVAWGLVAARLGRKKYRTAFHSAFWFGDEDVTGKEPQGGGVPGMKTRLTRWRDGSDPHPAWSEAREDFRRAEHAVDTLIRLRYHAQQRLHNLAELGQQEVDLTAIVDGLRRDLQKIGYSLTQKAPVEQAAKVELTRATAQHDRHLAAKPGALETILTLGRAVREWREQLTPIVDDLHAADNRHRIAAGEVQQIQAALQQAQTAMSKAQHDRAAAQAALSKLEPECARDADRYGNGYPGKGWAGDQRELQAPWLDPELDAARSELFLAALKLHQDFLANTAADMLNGLRAAAEVVAGAYPRRLEAEKLRAAWQLFFLAVPLVSTTFASMSRMFTGIGREAIGWLLIDEAGQATPQCAAGAIWRARRVMAVGDPLQLQPVVAIPHKVERDIASSYGVSATWIPPRASVQTLADRVATVGATLAQGEGEVWVSAPLRVHRRCDEPMFTLCNRIAYNGIMINDVHNKTKDATKPDLFEGNPAIAPVVVASYWADEPAGTPGSHLQPNQIERLQRALKYLSGCGVDYSEIIAIAPFRQVADNLRTLEHDYPGLRAGTIHTAQGREAPVVILVLSADPEKPGAKAWAASTVNLVNVAASRAQRRLYVIGDRREWARYNYFRQLSEALE